MPEDQIRTRAHLRFKPDPLEYALVALKSLDKAHFQPDFVALIVEESPVSGCSLIAHSYPGIEIDQECLVKIGDLAPLYAEIVWTKPVEGDLVRLGLRFLD